MRAAPATSSVVERSLAALSACRGSPGSARSAPARGRSPRRPASTVTCSLGASGRAPRRSRRRAGPRAPASFSVLERVAALAHPRHDPRLRRRGRGPAPAPTGTTFSSAQRFSVAPARRRSVLPPRSKSSGRALHQRPLSGPLSRAASADIRAPASCGSARTTASPPGRTNGGLGVGGRGVHPAGTSAIAGFSLPCRKRLPTADHRQVQAGLDLQALREAPVETVVLALGGGDVDAQLEVGNSRRSGAAAARSRGRPPDRRRCRRARSREKSASVGPSESRPAPPPSSTKRHRPGVESRAPEARAGSRPSFLTLYLRLKPVLQGLEEPRHPARCLRRGLARVVGPLRCLAAGGADGLIDHLPGPLPRLRDRAHGRLEGLLDGRPQRIGSGTTVFRFGFATAGSLVSCP